VDAGPPAHAAPVALANLGDDAGIVRDARALAELTTRSPLAGDAGVLTAVAIDRAVRERRLDGIRDGLGLLPTQRADWWAQRLDEAEAPGVPTVDEGHGVAALLAAHGVAHRTPVPRAGPGRHFVAVVDAALELGDAPPAGPAIAAQLVGARWGATSVPFRWRRDLHGPPGMRAADLVRLAQLTVSRGVPADDGWPLVPMLGGHRAGQAPYVAELPGDPGVLLGNLASLPSAVAGVDAVVSLCRVGAEEVPPEVEHHEVLLVDRADATANVNLDLVIEDTAEAVASLRDEGKRVFLHCVAGRSRTPTVAAAYLARREGLSGAEAFERVARVLPHPDPHNQAFQAALGRILPRPGS
jgi:ADP-ribosyl-[dinitrogen reductase] hydrolase